MAEFINWVYINLSTQVIKISTHLIMTRFKPLLHELKVDQISQLYFKHKIFSFKQICLNDFSYSIFTYVKKFYNNKLNPPKESFFAQFKEVGRVTGETFVSIETSIELINSKFQCNDLELGDCIKTTLDNYNCEYSYLCTFLLNSILYIDYLAT